MLPHTLLLACTLLLQGESAPEAPPAIVYVYRPWEAFGFGLEPAVFCDEQKVARMDNGRYFLLKLEPGVHAIRSSASTCARPITGSARVAHRSCLVKRASWR
jgi:hypothetical protein